MQFAIPRHVPVANIKDELLAAIEEFEGLFQRRPGMVALAASLENDICMFLDALPQTLCVFQPASTNDRKEAEREGVILCRLILNGVPCFASHVINELFDLDPDDAKLFHENWIVYLL